MKARNAIRGLLRAAVVTLVPVLIGATALSASASVSPSYSQYRSTTGASATCYVSDTGTYSATSHCTLRDTYSDGHCVYLMYQVQAFPSTRGSDWCGGSGTSTSKSANFSTDGAGYVYIKVCRDIAYYPDNCSSWMGFYVT